MSYQEQFTNDMSVIATSEYPTSYEEGMAGPQELQKYATFHSEDTQLSTPPCSPIPCGPTLLPRVRIQDQVIAHPSGYMHNQHMYTPGPPMPVFHPGSAPYEHTSRSMSPPGAHHYDHSATYTPSSAPPTIMTPISAPATIVTPVSYFSGPEPSRLSPESPYAANTSAGQRSMHTHSRGNSSSSRQSRSISPHGNDGVIVHKFGYPTYRQAPSFVGPSASAHSPMAMQATDPTNMQRAPVMHQQHVAAAPPPPVTPRQQSQPPISSHQRVPSIAMHAPQPPVNYQMPGMASGPALNFAPGQASGLTAGSASGPTEHMNPHADQSEYFENEPTTTVQDYLTGPNPCPRPVKARQHTPATVKSMHYWWDIRNVRNWDAFNLDAIRRAAPSFGALLDVPVAASMMPDPGTVNLNPRDVPALRDVYSRYYMTKVNAALRTTLGEPFMEMRACQPRQVPQGPTELDRGRPDFISNYRLGSEEELNLFGDTRGRIVGLVKTFDTWNSGMRHSRPEQTKYLGGLAHLHHLMRDHQCRYGFIMTEIELVCVRMGCESVPNFGFVELAPPVELSTYGRDRLTACLALWYMHMLVRDQQLPDQPSWRIHVGQPTALSRQKHFARDRDMIKTEARETREARRARGWIWPEERYNRKEATGTRRFAKPRTTSGPA